MKQPQSYYSGLSSEITTNLTDNFYTPRRLFQRDHWLGSKVFSLPNLKLDSDAKQIIFGISQEYIRLGIPHHCQLKIWYENIASYTGMSVKSVGACIDRLVRAGAMTKETKVVASGPRKEKKRRVFIAFTPEFLLEPAKLFSEIPDRDIGGNRPRRLHKNCGGEITNTCMKCGESRIQEKDIYIARIDESGEPVEEAQQREELARMDEYIAATDRYYDAAEIDDDVVDAMGGVERALAASNREIAVMMGKPIHERQGLTDEDLEAIDQAFKSMGKQKSDLRGWWG